MARAKIQINGVDSTATTVALGATVLLSNDDEGGETTYAWTIIDQPEGTADVLSNATIENPSLVVNKEGTYVLRLVVNALLGTEAIQTATVSVLDARTNERIPAATETLETGAVKGWALAMNRIVARTLHATGDGNVIVAQTPGGIASRAIVKLANLGTIHPGSPSEFVVPQILAVDGTLPHDQRLGILVDGVIPGDVAAGRLVTIRMHGMVPISEAGSPAVSDRVYLSNAGLPSLVAGTVSRKLGYVVASSGGLWQWAIDSGATSVNGADLLPGTVTVDKFADIVGQSFLGRSGVGSGPPEVMSLSTARAVMRGTFLARQVFTLSGTYTPNAIARTVIWRQSGGGGGGGGVLTDGGGGGGNSGFYIEHLITSSSVITGGAVTIGAGGAAGASGGGNGGTGGDTSIVVNGVTFIAKGGTGGSGATPAVPVALPLPPQAGSTAGTNVLRYGAGHPGLTFDTREVGGGGGDSPLGSGGAWQSAGTAIGNAGTFGGGGGGGAGDGFSITGGAGGAGLVIIDEYS